MILFLYGIIFATAITATLFFHNFWRKTGDSLFLLFAIGFGLLGVERLVLAFLTSGAEYQVYFIRLAAYIFIIVAVVQKNRGKNAPSHGRTDRSSNRKTARS